MTYIQATGFCCRCFSVCWKSKQKRVTSGSESCLERFYLLVQESKM